MEFFVPASYGEAEFTEKRSRFTGRVWNVESEAEARKKLEETKAKHYDARHNCWCYILHEGGILRYSDDGEPQGTAGQPMLEVFRRSGVENAVCVVTRYFGGILLGAGGLTRAYSHAAKIALDAAGIFVMRLWKLVMFSCPYNLFERIKLETERRGIIESIDYGADIMVEARLPEKDAEAYCAWLTDMSAGTVQAFVAGERYAPGPITGDTNSAQS